MSMQKITVQKAAKPYICDKCRVEIPRGTEYRKFFIGFRSKRPHIRCMAPTCFPRPSERESSKLADVYSAQEAAEDTLRSFDFDGDELVEDFIETVMSDLGASIREVAEEYREASVNPNTGSVFNTEAEERADTLDGAADEAEGFTPDPVDDEPEGSREAMEQAIEQAVDFVNSLELP